MKKEPQTVPEFQERPLALNGSFKTGGSMPLPVVLICIAWYGTDG